MLRRSSNTHQQLNLTSASDQMLLELTRDGINDAFGELWSRHSGAVRAAVRNHTGYEPDDLMQEAFLKVFTGIHNGGELPASFRAYVATVARNLATDRSRRDHGVFLESYDDQEDQRAHEQDDFSERVFDDSTTSQAFRGLPSRHREVLWYRDVEDLPVQEIARYVGMSPNSTTVLIKRARDAFKTEWIKAHLSPDRGLPEECRDIVTKLAKFTRGKLAATENARVELHLLDCTHCAALASEAGGLHKKLALMLLPLFLMGGSPGYFAWIQSKNNRVTPPAQANYVPIQVVGGRTVPSFQSEAARTLLRPRTKATFAVAAAVATLLITGGIASGVIRAGEANNLSPLTTQNTAGTHGERTGDSRRGGGAKNEAQPSADRSREVIVDSNISSTIESVPSAQNAFDVHDRAAVVSPLPEPVTVAPEPSSSVDPTAPTDPSIDEPFYPEPRVLGVTTENDPFVLRISSTAGATIYIRAALPRSNWGLDDWTVVLTADENGYSSYDFPDLRGRTVNLVIQQRYPAASELDLSNPDLQYQDASYVIPPA